MENVSIICSYEFPGKSAAANRVKALAQVLSKKYRVHIITLTEDINKADSLEYRDAIHIHYVKYKNYNKQNFITRSLHELRVSFRLNRLAKTLDSDELVVSIPSMFLIPATVIVNRKTRKILDVRDLVWEYLPDQKITYKIIKAAVRSGMIWGINRFNHVAASNNSEIAWIQEHTATKSPVLARNGIDKESFEELKTVASGKKSNAHVNIVYAGNIGIAQRLDTLVDVAEMLPHVFFSIAGDGNDRERVELFAEKREVSNLFFLGSLDKKELINLYKNADILFAQLDESFASAVPSKLYEYLSTGLPVVYAGTGEAVNFLKNFENTYCTAPCNPSQIKDAIKEVSAHLPHVSYTNIEKIGKKYIREETMKKYLDILENR